MRTLNEIHADIDSLTERRTELWHALSEGFDPGIAAERRRLDDRIAELWEEHRMTRASLRFGDRSRIIARARTEERLERAA